MIPAILIFAGTYLVIAIGKLPGYLLDRAGAALLGATLMVVVGVLTPEEALKAVDLQTIVLLLGMMIVVANLHLSGFFRLAASWAVDRARHPLALLASIVAVTGALSAFLVNDTICLVMTPLVVEVVQRLKRNPVPYLLGVAMASNAGSVATITGNPQNMIVGSLSGISYTSFAAALAPVAVVGLVITTAVIALLHRDEFLGAQRLQAVRTRPVRYNRPLVVKSLAITAAMVALFFYGMPIAEVAILGGALLLVTRRVKPQKVYFAVDWPLLVMFIGLFIVVAGLDTAVIGPQAVETIKRLNLHEVPILAAVTAILGNLVSNVPGVLVLAPFIPSFADPEQAWLVVAMASTLAGNLTLVGSVANLIVAQRARAAGVHLGFWAYLRVGAPVTLLSLAFGVWWLS